MRKWQAIVLGLFLIFSPPLLADQGNISVTINNTSPDDPARTNTAQPQINVNTDEIGQQPIVSSERPILLTIDNGTDYDLQAMQIATENISQDDVEKLKAQVLDQHQQHTFSLARTGFPARIFVTFQVTATEGVYSGQLAGRWQYLEDPAEAYVCHIAAGNDPYMIGCSGDNSMTQPIVDLEITFNKSPTGPWPTPLPSP